MSRQKHDRQWLAFVEWCRNRRLKPLPAHPWTIAAFLRWIDRRDAGKTSRVEAGCLVKIISRAHLLAGYASPHNHPVIEKTRASIERRKSTEAARADLFRFDRANTRHHESALSGAEKDRQEREPEVVAGIRTNFSMRMQPKLVPRRRQNF